MPLLNICAVTSNNKVIQVGLCFMSREKEVDYDFLIRCLREVMRSNDITKPLVAITDRELALIKAIETYFPQTDHLLCQWHVNMNVLSQCKKHFPGALKIDGIWKRHPTFTTFLAQWNQLLRCSTEDGYQHALDEFRRQNPPQAVSYCERTWLVWKEKLVRFWVNKTTHFGYLVTSTIEGCHAGLKKYLKASMFGLDGVFQRLKLFWIAQHYRILSFTS
jgi:hypothetical protein